MPFAMKREAPKTIHSSKNDNNTNVMMIKSILYTLVAMVSFTTATFAQNIPSFVPANGLVGWWPFNGNANDESGNGNHGTVNGATLTADRYGNVGKAYNLNGVTDFIQTTYPGISSSGSRTVTFWANPEAVASNSYAFSYGGPFPGGIFGATVRCTPSDNIGTVIGSAFINFFNPAVCGNWNFYCYSFPPGGQNQSNIKVYQNGLLLTNPTSQYNPTTIVNTANSSPLTFGKLVYVDGYPSNFKGRLDDFGFWNRELSQAEITRLYQAGLPYSISTQRDGTCPGNSVAINASTSVFLTTVNAQSVTNNAAISGGNIINAGGQTITQRGVCWSTSPNPTVTLSTKTSDGAGSGSFSSSLTGLSAFTTFCVRAYATTASGTWYGDEKSFITAAATNTVTDIDGNVYNTVAIGTQTWMKENLKVSKYRNGDAIPTNLSNTAWNATASGAYAIYNNDLSNNTIYGKLYNWYAVSDSRGICPVGWHVPSDSDFSYLEIHVDPSINVLNTGLRGLDGGGKLKSLNSGFWKSPNTGANNQTSFSALPGGYRGGGLNPGNFGGIYSEIQLWSISEYSSTNAWARYLRYDSSQIGRGFNFKLGGCSVRCIKD